jgi:hypothetical protein
MARSLPRTAAHEFARDLADALRTSFPSIQPTAVASPVALTKGARGLRRLDVNYSTRHHGLELAAWVKPLPTTRDGVARLRARLRTRSADVHRRQPYAVLTTFLLAPDTAHAEPPALELDTLSGRSDPSADPARLEHLFIVSRAPDGHLCLTERGRQGPPLSLDGAVGRLRDTHRARSP